MGGNEPTSSRIEAILEEYLHRHLGGEIVRVDEFLSSVHHGLQAGEEEEVRGLLKSITAPPDFPPASLPDRIGPYLIEAELGRGGQGAVFLASDPRLSRHVALKVLNEPLLVSPEDHASLEGPAARMRREAEIASRLDHPNICTIYEIGSHRHLPYIAMRYVGGETLARLISRAAESGEPLVLPAVEGESSDGPAGESSGAFGGRRARNRARVLRLVERAARAVHVAHEAGIVHRDVKPGNVMVTPEGEPVLLDFGLARDQRGEGTVLTLSGQVIGSPAYMSPEQLAPETTAVDQRTDVYSLGVTLYECLLLERPFQATTRDGLCQAIRRSPLPDLRRRRDVISRDLEVVLGTALEKDPERRYQSALDLAEDLRRARNHEPIRARPSSRLLRLKRWSQRNPILATTLTAALLFLTAALAGALWTLDRERAQQRERLGNLLVAHALASLPEQPTRALLLAIEAAEHSPTAASREALHQTLYEIHERRAIRAHDSAIIRLVESPDGRLAVTASEAGEVKVWDPRTLRNLDSFIAHDGRVAWVGFGPEGIRLATAGEDGELRLWQTSTWECERVLSGHGHEVMFVGFGPAGSDHLASLSRDGELRLWTLSTGESIQLVPPDASTLEVGEPPALSAHLGGGVLVTRHASLVRTWSLTDGELLLELARDTGVGNCQTVVTSPDGSLLFVARSDGTIEAVEIGTGRERWHLDPEGSAPTFLAAARDAPLLLAGYSGGLTVLRRMEDGATLHRLPETEGSANNAVFSAAGRFVLVMIGNDTFRIWRSSDGGRCGILRGMGSVASRPLCVDPGNSILSAGEDGFLRKWDHRSDGERREFAAPGAPLTSVFGPTGRRLLVSARTHAWILDAETFEILVTVSAANDPVKSAVFSPDGTSILLASLAGDSILYDASNGEERARFRSGSPVWHAAFDPTGERIVNASENGIAGIFDVQSRRLLVEIEGHEGGVRHATFGPAGLVLATTSEQDGSVRVWRIETREEIARLTPEGRIPASSRFSPGGDRLVTATWQGDALLWAWRDPGPPRVLVEHTAYLDSAEFSPDGTHLALASRDGTFSLWDAAAEERLLTLDLHRGMVHDASFSPDGRSLVTCSHDETVRLWPVDVLEAARAAKPCELTEEERREFGLR